MTKYFDAHENSFNPIPEAPYYVVSTDTFMSNWGHAQGKQNYCVVPCHTSEQANLVFQYVNSRSDQKNVRIVETVPANGPDRIYSLLEEWTRTAARKAKVIEKGLAGDTVYSFD